jgi:aminopeptidase-like protein
MIRRWSYIASDKIEQNYIKQSLKPILIKKGFKQTVRFRKNHFKISKILKKRYSTRKIKNSNFSLIINAFSWSKFYIYASNYEKRAQYKYILPSKITAKSQNLESLIHANFKTNVVKFKIFNAKNKKRGKSY